MSARQDAIEFAHALDQVAEERKRVWDAAEQLAEALEAMRDEAETVCRLERERTKGHGWYPAMEDHRIPQARAALAEWKKVSG